MATRMVEDAAASGTNPPMLTGSQIRAARALLGWSAQDLADRAGVGYATVARAEQAKGVPRTTAPRLFAIQASLQNEGIIFIDEGHYAGDGGPGVRLRRD